MYLKGLMQGEKYAFYHVVRHMAAADGEFSDVEKELINGFLNEMDIVEDQIPNISFEDAIDMFTFSTFTVRKKVYFELVGVALCDEILHEDEKEFLDEVAEKLTIKEDVKKAIFDTVNDLFVIYKRMQVIVDSELAIPENGAVPERDEE